MNWDVLHDPRAAECFNARPAHDIRRIELASVLTLHAIPDHCILSSEALSAVTAIIGDRP